MSVAVIHRLSSLWFPVEVTCCCNIAAAFPMLPTWTGSTGPSNRRAAARIWSWHWTNPRISKEDMDAVPLNNSYCQVMRIRDGKLAEVKEYFDTELAASAFGSHSEPIPGMQSASPGLLNEHSETLPMKLTEYNND